MRKVTYWLEEVTGLTAEIQEDMLLSLIVVVCLWVLSRLFRRLIVRQQSDLRKQYRWRKVSNYIISGLAFILLINIWFEGFASVATFLGLLSAGLVLALKEPILNIAGWLFIIWKRPFRIGDRIKVGDNSGDVIDIRLFQFTLNEIQSWVEADQATGRVVNIPNGKLFTEPQSNYNYGFPFIWHEISMHVTFESNWQKAKELLLEIGSKHAEQLNEAAEQQIRKQSQKHLIFYNDLKPKLYTSVRENGIRLTLRYLCSILRRRESENLIWEEVLQNFLAAPDISFAYPTTRFYQQNHNNGMQTTPEPIDGLD
ncbi:MAG: mechanosensitive ion channel family protein [Hymenobacteraceae bacterium]|nr:mechanosensitive ion channel family protein [Hymenobacteraceae bacterium]MDX5396395.1 mechanosensitive ion channel family protein [Hymenobacteraceae bacterium]MDX5443803.1 mechanosensitive ion channel family protein [Hymenobacteraceae bacterium]MDX5512457.1 mechanosensitive ion channel family protein [Hymenobacteraceae bacterium]